MLTSDKGVALIKRHEGCRLSSYRCPAGKLTIGYGHTGPDVREGIYISLDFAETLLEEDLKSAEEDVNKQGLKLNQNQFDALVSFVYNLGDPNFKSSTLLKKVKANPDDPTIGNEFRRWTKSGKEVLPGLVKRREDEANLYFLKS